MNFDDIIELRHSLHQHPELSNAEYETKDRIKAFFRPLNPDEVIIFDGTTGVAFVWKGSKPGKTIVFRSELDALPIDEAGDLPYKSVNSNVAHVCGHDGHMSIIAGLGKLISANPPDNGSVVLLYQPAEEMYQGAADIVNHPKFKDLKADMIYGLHNIPGLPTDTIVLRNREFAAASRGMHIQLTGKTSHAAEPEKGISPAGAIARLVKTARQLENHAHIFEQFVLATIIHIKLGDAAYGTSPGKADFMFTLRAFTNKDMETLCQHLEKAVQEIAQDENLSHKIDYNEEFPATVNNPVCTEHIRNASLAIPGLKIKELETPFRWSEDFGYFTEQIPGGFFGIGSGVGQPALHNPDFDFPDEILEHAANLFYNIYKKLLIKN